MSKGIKMEFSKKNDSGDTIYHISKLKKSDNGNLHCRYCGTDVQYVSSYTRGASNTPVSAYLKLWQDAEHSDECGYSVRGAVDLLVAESKSVEDTTPIFVLQDDGSYLFRMNILVDAHKVAQDLSKYGKGFEASEHLSSRRNYIRSEKQLASYFRSAAGIAKLRSLIQESPDVEALKGSIKIQYKDSFVSWNDFYYDETRYRILFNRLLKGQISHPVAVNITLKGEASLYGEAKYFPWSFQSYSQTVTSNGKKLVYIPKLQLARGIFTKNISAGDTLLVVGDVRANKIKDESSIFRGFNISVFNRSQFKKEIESE
ncbi:hypothetical protein [Alloalcanivorax gelatiniphagus]|uniref:Uncharacterized protein n=1 Tax=Alloalcanivorax gelatiniphagus TaxID=1194167 RepID=A0ABY2XHR8_9GAMM|nr:hypothetical protein [Alloalcanivorax gelatiniphagus]TMW10867.1 hypothetical protein FGS76_16280 [Alloalcanivorax gelatiniphagus]